MGSSSPTLLAAERFDRLWDKRDPKVIGELRAEDARSPASPP